MLKALKEFDEDLWWEVARDCPYSTFFHTPAWTNAVVNAYERVSDATLAFELQGGGHAVLPLQERGKVTGILRQLTSTFAGSYGDVITNGPITEVERQAIYQKATSGLVGKIKIVDNPFTSAAPKPGFDSTEDFTQVMPLEDGYKTLAKGYKRSCRKQVNKAVRQGLAARPASTHADLDAYFALYQANLERWGKADKAYKRELFEALVFGEQVEDSCEAKLWLVETDQNQVIGGTLVLYWKWHAVEWQAAFDGDYFRHGVRNFLVDKIIQDACLRGLRVYDFNPSGGYDGVVQFKETFGPELQPLRRWSYQHPALRFWRRVRKMMPRL